MSKHRISKSAGYVDPSKLPKGPNGRPLCRYCGTETQPPRRTFCSDACIHEWKIRTQPGYVRDEVLKRDHGICAICRIDTKKLKALIVRLNRRRTGWFRFPKQKASGPTERPAIQQSSSKRLNRIKEKLPWAFSHSTIYNGRFETANSLWQADHIIPVAEGGGECGLENYRTLCTGCHKSVTKDLMGRLAKAKRSKPDEP